MKVLKILTLFIAIQFPFIKICIAAPVGQIEKQSPVGKNWYFLGDSQTIGRAKQKESRSHALIVKKIWQDTFKTNVSQLVDGESGRTLEGTMKAYMKTPNPEYFTWIHIQESGNQLSGGGTQNTPEKFAVQLELFLREVNKRSPDALISLETAYSFEAYSIKGRDWTKYNTKIIEVTNRLKNDGIIVHLVPVDTNINSLVKIKRNQLGFTAGQQSVWGDVGNRIKRHYTGLGNFMIALSIFDTLGIDLYSLDLSSIPLHEITKDDKELCIKILNQ